MQTVPVVGDISARQHVLMRADVESQSFVIPCPNHNYRTVAVFREVDVSGKASVTETLYYDSVQLIPEDIRHPGTLVIAKIDLGPIFLGRLLQGAGEGTFHLIGDGGAMRFDVPLKWVMPIRWIMHYG